MSQKVSILYRTDKEVFVAITETIWVATRNFFRPMYIFGGGDSFFMPWKNVPAIWNESILIYEVGLGKSCIYSVCASGMFVVIIRR